MVWTIVVTDIDLPAEQANRLAQALLETARTHTAEARSYTIEQWRYQQTIRPATPPMLPSKTKAGWLPEHEHRYPARRREGAQGSK